MHIWTHISFYAFQCTTSICELFSFNAHLMQKSNKCNIHSRGNAVVITRGPLPEKRAGSSTSVCFGCMRNSRQV